MIILGTVYGRLKTTNRDDKLIVRQVRRGQMLAAPR